jgi:PAS domain S-box-containing protein/putative nucleotidyltransferase with HDIG domain
VAMRASEEKFSRMFQGNPVSMAVLDLDTACYVEVNAAWQRQTGYSAAEVVGRDMWSLNLWEGFSPMNDLAALFNERGQIDRLGGSMRTKSGVMRSALITAHIVDIGGRDRVLTVLEDVTDRKRAESDLTRTVEQLGRLTNQAIVTISKLVEARDPYTAGHEARVADLAVAIAQEMSIEPERVAGLRVAGLLHDVGKTAVPSEILTRPGALSDVEWAMVRLHAAAGHEILSGIDFPWPVAAIVLQHHERLNGSGYPAGLTDGDIMLEARIIAVADVVEAMFAHRPYRPSRGIAAALDEIESGKGELYDADVVDACLALFREDRFIFADV